MGPKRDGQLAGRQEKIIGGQPLDQATGKRPEQLICIIQIDDLYDSEDIFLDGITRGIHSL